MDLNRFQFARPAVLASPVSVTQEGTSIDDNIGR